MIPAGVLLVAFGGIIAAMPHLTRPASPAVEARRVAVVGVVAAAIILTALLAHLVEVWHV